MKASLDDRIARATQLIDTHPAAGELLRFYRELATCQKPIYEALRASGETDLFGLLRYFPGLLALVRRAGPAQLADFGAEHLTSPDAQRELLLTVWEGEATHEADDVDDAARFYARVLLQPYAEHLALQGRIDLEQTTSVCPFCSARPVAGVLRGEGDGAKRWMLCSLCATEWPFLRVMCPGCGEREKDQLPVYTTPDIPAVRIDACDRCRTYIKSIDLTRDGHAVPAVDEIATVALNIWADENGYTKLETNLLGM